MSFLDYSLEVSIITCSQVLRITLFVGDCINLSFIALMCAERKNRYEFQNCVVFIKYVLKQIMNTSNRNQNNIDQKHTQPRTSVSNCNQKTKPKQILNNICGAHLMTVIRSSSYLDVRGRSPLTSLLVTIFAM